MIKNILILSALVHTLLALGNSIEIQRNPQQSGMEGFAQQNIRTGSGAYSRYQQLVNRHRQNQPVRASWSTNRFANQGSTFNRLKASIARKPSVALQPSQPVLQPWQAVPAVLRRPIYQQRLAVNPLQNPPPLLPRPASLRGSAVNPLQNPPPLLPRPIHQQRLAVNPLQNPPPLLPRPAIPRGSAVNPLQNPPPLLPRPIHQQRLAVNPLQNPPPLLPRPVNFRQERSEFLAEQNEQTADQSDLLAQVREDLNLRNQEEAMRQQAEQKTVVAPIERDEQTELSTLLGLKLAERRAKVEEDNDEEDDFWGAAENHPQASQQYRTQPPLLQTPVNLQQEKSESLIEYNRPTDDRNDLLAQIRGGVNLRRIAPENAEIRSTLQEERNGISKLLSLGLAKLRVESNEKDDEDEEVDADEWED